MPKDQILSWYADVAGQLASFGRLLVRPISYASMTEAIIVASLGLISLIAAAVINRRGLRSPEHERIWTERRLQVTGVFGILAIVLAFLRYEGIPYVSMSVVLGIVLLWALISFAQLALYKRLVLTAARSQWREHKAREQYLPQPTKRSK